MALMTTQENKEEVIKSLTDYLNFIRHNTVNFGNRLLEPFQVSNYSFHRDNVSIFVELSNEKMKSGNHYWVNKRDFQDFKEGKKKSGVVLDFVRHYIENGHTVFELNLKKNNLSNKISDIAKLNNVNIRYQNGLLYKVLDVQVKNIDENHAENIIKLFVKEVRSIKDFIDSKVVLKNKVEKRGSISIELGAVEEYLSKENVFEALKLERSIMAEELTEWIRTIPSEEMSNHLKEKIINRIFELSV